MPDGARAPRAPVSTLNPVRALLGHLPSFREDPIGFYAACAREHGEVVELRFGHVRGFLISNADAAKRVYLDNEKNYTKDTPLFDQLRLVLGDGLLTSQGASWRRRRRIAQPAFGRDRLAWFADIMSAAAGDLAASWGRAAERREAVDIQADTMRVAFTVVGKSLLGADLSPETARVEEALPTVLEALSHRLGRGLPAPMWVPTPTNRRLSRAMATLDALVADLVAHRRRGPKESSVAAAGEERARDLLDMLIETRDEETGEALDDRALRDEVMTILHAGHETTASSLAWSFCLLAQHPEWRAAAEAEVDAVLGGRVATLADVPRLDVVRRVFAEALRLYPPIWSIGRRASDDDVLAGYRIPRGSLVITSAYVMHRNARHWPDPERFDPDRFLAAREQGMHKYAYLPFGAGPRICIGKHFALLEGQIVLATLLSRFRAGFADASQPLEPAPTLSLRPPVGLRMRVEERRS